jgi:ATP-dependent Lhr-like helicase
LLRPVRSHAEPSRDEIIDHIATQLLRRYGVVFRDLFRNESPCAWRDLLVRYRRMELRGEVRGGRFVSGFTGEQFALPEALEALRTVRKQQNTSSAGQELRLSASDPLNLVGIILPGPRVPAVPSNFVVFRDGQFVRTILGRESRASEAGELPSVVDQRG